MNHYSAVIWKSPGRLGVDVLAKTEDLPTREAAIAECSHLAKEARAAGCKRKIRGKVLKDGSLDFFCLNHS